MVYVPKVNVTTVLSPNGTANILLATSRKEKCKKRLGTSRKAQKAMRTRNMQLFLYIRLSREKAWQIQWL